MYWPPVVNPDTTNAKRMPPWAPLHSAEAMFKWLSLPKEIPSGTTLPELQPFWLKPNTCPLSFCRLER